jgi:hypothetical protein
MMRLFLTFLLIITTLAFAACSRGASDVAENTGPGSAPSGQSGASEKSAAVPQTQNARTSTSTATTSTSTQADSSANAPQYQKVSDQQQVSATQADAERAAHVADERKIIRNAELNLESGNPAEGQRKVAAIAEAHGGFVVTSDARQRDGEDQTKPELTINIIVRVPSDQFSATLDEIRGTANRVRQEKITGQDVTEEYFDLEARIKTKKALEAQFMEIMKQARSVADALQVQSQLADVRTEIERLEGRRRYLENQSSLSTITVTLASPALLVNTNSTGFLYQVKRAFGSGVDIAAGITLFLIQAFLALLPVAILIFLPLGLLVRYLVRRSRRLQLARSLVQDEAQPVPQTR